MSLTFRFFHAFLKLLEFILLLGKPILVRQQIINIVIIHCCGGTATTSACSWAPFSTHCNSLHKHTLNSRKLRILLSVDTSYLKHIILNIICIRFRHSCICDDMCKDYSNEVLINVTSVMSHSLCDTWLHFKCSVFHMPIIIAYKRYLVS